jgi:hypothetical protein
VDGPAGSGKTTFADRLARALREAGARVAVVHTDDLLEGWTDMVSFWPRLRQWVLEPLARGESARFRRYDWDRGRFGDQWHELAVPDVLVVEGVTSARVEAAPLLSRAVFVLAEPGLRLARGLERDGEALRDEWLGWMDGESRHFAAEGTRERADVRVDGAAAAGDERSFVRLP